MYFPWTRRMDRQKLTQICSKSCRRLFTLATTMAKILINRVSLITNFFLQNRTEFTKKIWSQERNVHRHKNHDVIWKLIQDYFGEIILRFTSEETKKYTFLILWKRKFKNKKEEMQNFQWKIFIFVKNEKFILIETYYRCFYCQNRWNSIHLNHARSWSNLISASLRATILVLKSVTGRQKMTLWKQNTSTTTTLPVFTDPSPWNVPSDCSAVFGEILLDKKFSVQFVSVKFFCVYVELAL